MRGLMWRRECKQEKRHRDEKHLPPLRVSLPRVWAVGDEFDTRGLGIERRCSRRGIAEDNDGANREEKKKKQFNPKPYQVEISLVGLEKVTRAG